MNRFHKITREHYKELTGSDIGYDNIILPKRSTKNSAGYDFVSPKRIVLEPNKSIFFTTGIQVELDADKCLILMPRSGLGCKYKLRFNNTVGLIDSDFYNANGVISASLSNEGNETVIIEAGERFMQGVILQYFKTEDDDTDSLRQGGFGSTGKH